MTLCTEIGGELPWLQRQRLLARQKLQQRNEAQQQEQAEASASSGNEDEAAGVIAAENRPPPPIRKNFEGSSWEKVCTDLDLVILYYFIY